RVFTTKSAGAQEAHEAIRPTDFNRPSITGDAQQAKLYQLIWQRAAASQMTDAKLEKTIVTVAPENQPERFTAQAETIQFEGFLKVYSEGRDEESDDEEGNLLPPLGIGQVLPLEKMVSRQSFSRPKARYTEASLVRQLEEMGIGRPSTFAPTISTIQDRQYVIKGEVEGTERGAIELTLTSGEIKRAELTETVGADRNKLLPTPIGELVTDFLVKYFPAIVDFNFTAKAETQLDTIAEGKQEWQTMIKDFYKPFHETVVAAEGISRQEVAQARLIGNHPKTGKPIYARLGRFGPMLQMGEASDEEKPTFAPIPDGQKLNTINLDEALTLFALPRGLGTTEDGAEITANYGPFGPYARAGKLNVSIKPDDPFSITLERARQLIKDKQIADANKLIAEFPDSSVQVLNGRFGPYITDGKKNARIPKDADPKTLTLEDCQKLLDAAPARKGKRTKR
ncbi:MAG TPA: DNA topoisomerase, partial [Candidatus Polarisedimenticolaceae bacterium]|nr:DNA topoisomerase [Candidatus Polarisedimenticolaceae bacterium]